MELIERKRVRIEFHELPPRTRLVTAAELSRIFGGEGACGGAYVECQSDKDCCDCHFCYTTNNFNRCLKMTLERCQGLPEIG
jgi:hypothetical protein